MEGPSAFWAKARRTVNGELQTHSVLCHLLDVGAVCLEFLMGASPGLRKSIADLFPHLSEKAAVWLICAVIALHDLGKVSPGFQYKEPELAEELRTQGFVFPQDGAETDHGVVSLYALEEAFQELLKTDRFVRKRLADAIAGHHGRFLLTRKAGRCGDEKWRRARKRTVLQVFSTFGIDTSTAVEIVEPTAAHLCMLAGLTSIVDWIGSDEATFPFAEGNPPDLGEYLNSRRQLASEVLRRYGLVRNNPTQLAGSSFPELFDKSPYPLQSRFIELVNEAETPFLAIVETPTGSGKTEAVLGAYSELVRRSALGLYYALPTKTTGNQMFSRVKRFLTRRFLGSSTELHLLHGEAAFHPEYQALRRSEVFGSSSDSTLKATSWFAGRKRALLAEHGVGTIDQAMLAAMQVKHFFVRLFGLMDKVVVLDEVHAYDAYMTEIIERLVGWLHQMGASVVLLSATLPEGRKRRLMEAYGPTCNQQNGRTQTNPDVAPYPSLTIVDDVHGLRSESVEVPPRPTLGVELMHVRAEQKLDTLAEKATELVTDGGCIGVIVNTVSEAQALYEKIKALVPPDVTLRLFHARFTRARRQELETELETMLGAGTSASRPRKLVAIATQVVEQSVDFDFDCLLSDLAPIDLLLQRAGRMHRRSNTSRPPHHSTARLFVCVPAELHEEGPTQPFGSSGFIYYPAVLARTADVLARVADRGGSIQVPGGVSELIELVYGEPSGATPGLDGSQSVPAETLSHWSEEAYGEDCAMRWQAARFALPQVTQEGDSIELFDDLHALDDSDERPVTRLGADSVTLIVVPAGELDWGQQEHEDPTSAVHNSRVSGSQAEDYLQAAVPIGHQRWVEYFREQEVPPRWKHHWFLRYARPLELRHGRFECDVGALEYDNEIGLRILQVSQKEKTMDSYEGEDIV